MAKTIPIRVRMTLEEINELEQFSIKILGTINVSRIVRKSIRDFIGFGPDLLDYQMTEFRMAVRQLTGLSRNFNQVTKAINSTPSNLSKLNQDLLLNLATSVDELNSNLVKIIVQTKQRQGGVIEQ